MSTIFSYDGTKVRKFYIAQEEMFDRWGKSKSRETEWDFFFDDSSTTKIIL